MAAIVSTSTKSLAPSARHKKLHADMAAFMKERMGDMPADEILAILSYTVGQVLALQDQRKMTPAMGLAIVSDNIEAGNRYAMAAALSADERAPQ